MRDQALQRGDAGQHLVEAAALQVQRGPRGARLNPGPQGPLAAIKPDLRLAADQQLDPQLLAKLREIIVGQDDGADQGPDPHQIDAVEHRDRRQIPGRASVGQVQVQAVGLQSLCLDAVSDDPFVKLLPRAKDPRPPGSARRKRGIQSTLQAMLDFHEQR